MAIFKGRDKRKGTPADWLIVGLGNPGSEYEETRHNVGAKVVDLLANRHSSPLKKSKYRALMSGVNLSGHKIILAFPTTFMNNSGEAVRKLVDSFGVSSSDRIVVVHDELDLEVGDFRLKQGGGFAGHNGLKSVNQHLGTADFLRLRIGVGRPPSPVPSGDYVLKRPSRAHQKELDVVLVEAADAIEQLVSTGLDKTMPVVNARKKS